MSSVLTTSTLLCDDDTLHFPLLSIEYLDVLVDFNAYNTIIITSRHAVLGIKDNICSLKCNVLVVGEKTASCVRNKLKIEPVVYKNVKKLEENLKLSIFRLNILYLRGKYISYNLYDALSKYHSISEIITYNAHPKTSIPDNIVKMLTNGQIRFIKIYSKRSYQIFINLTSNINHKAKLIFPPIGLYEKCK